MTTAKALGQGVQVGAFLARGQAASAMVPGDHGSTYGGNPFVGAAAEKVLDIFASRKLAEHAEELGNYLWEKLEEIKAKYSVVKDHRGMGLLQGLELSISAGEIIRRALLEERLVLINAGANIIRFVPPLVIEKEDVDEETLMMEAIEAGATDFIAEDEDVFEIRTEANDVGVIRDELEAKGYKTISSEPAYIPSTYTRLESQDDMMKMSRMIDMFEENDDVQNIWHNWENEDEYQG